MGPEYSPHCPRAVSRRSFLLGAATGLAAGAPLGLLGWQAYKHFTVPGGHPTPVAVKPSQEGMPGRYPGRVIEVHHPAAVDRYHRIDRTAVARMMDRGMCELTGADHPVEAWRSFFDPDDVVGIKVNPVGSNKNNPRVVGSISNPEVLLETVRGLKMAGVPAKNIIVFERYANEFVAAGYADVLREREMDGVRWYASGAGYSPTQLEIDGVGDRNAHSPELLRHVVGYDPDAFAYMGFAAPDHDPKDDRRFRSHLSFIVSKMVNKVVTLPVLKDHRSAGVTLALKNMSHGFNNNVARSHISNIAHGYPDSPGRDVSGPNQCNTFIPTAVNQPAIKQKATLHILDGLIGVFEGGPGVWNKTWGTWRYNALFFATDPVAMDHVGWDIIDAKRVSLGLPRVGDMGLGRFTSADKVRMALAPLAGQGVSDALALNAAERFVRGGGDSEAFDRRQPEHIYLAGTIGLGQFDLAKITHRRLQVG